MSKSTYTYILYNVFHFIQVSRVFNLRQNSSCFHFEVQPELKYGRPTVYIVEFYLELLWEYFFII